MVCCPAQVPSSPTPSRETLHETFLTSRMAGHALRNLDPMIVYGPRKGPSANYARFRKVLIGPRHDKKELSMAFQQVLMASFVARKNFRSLTLWVDLVLALRSHTTCKQSTNSLSLAPLELSKLDSFLNNDHERHGVLHNAYS